ncbi:MAG: DNA repair protein RadC [Candidatus Bipolaricaulota bacterium]|nr:DNA repair protein RadC [Candidatus Bipolaricaulota bacterium]
MKMIKDLPELDRPREKLLSKGPMALSDSELLAILIGSGMKGTNALTLATKILRKIDLRSDKLDVDALEEIPGVGPAKASRIAAAFELVRRRLQREGTRVREAKDVLPFVQQIRDKHQEYFLCLSLNGANEVIENRVVTVGLLDSNQVHPREVYADPLTDRAASIIVAHNHPSGTLEASPEDVALTDRLARAGKLLGIPLLDHIIVTKRGYLSLKQAGYL